jgi:uncharacterized phage protein (TIGR01671 family)
MSRKIKFKLWAEDIKKMIPWSYRFLPEWFHEEHDLILLQYTGFNDKNGREIYEGDILNHLVNKESGNWASPMVYLPENAFPISFQDGGFVNDYNNRPMAEWMINKVSHKIEYEIIGNIYQNDDILKYKMIV